MSRTISKKYLLTYPDGSRKHIHREERDSLLLAGCAKQTAPERYFYIGPVHTFHSFADLGQLQLQAEPMESRRFLPGSFIVEMKGKKYRELMETPGAMVYRLSNGTSRYSDLRTE